MNNSLHPSRTAVVLGGGGSTGNAWLIGVVAGLYDSGLDVTTADLTVGTSAGSTAAAQLSGATPTQLFATTVTAVPPQRPGPGYSAGPVLDHLERSKRILAASANPADLRLRMGAAALERAAESDGSERWRAIVATRLPSHEWPERRVVITAVDAHTGEAVEFDRESGVDLVDAVAASCSSGSAYRIGDKQYIDGGYRTNAENADLAEGYDRVLVLSPFGGHTLTPPEWRMDLATQVEALRAGGSRVEIVVPTAESENLFGANAMDLSQRPRAARVGYDQGSALAVELRDFWLASAEPS